MRSQESDGISESVCASAVARGSRSCLAFSRARLLRCAGTSQTAKPRCARVREERRGRMGRHMMEASNFIDYYEILEISPNANSGTIERIFRYFAQRYHPDNQDTGDRHRFETILEAYNTLKDPVKRAQYDLQHKNHSAVRWKLAEEASDSKGLEQDIDIQNKLLSILYVKRRQNISDPGIGNAELERLLGCPDELLKFHLWYLKEKGWIERTETGTLAISVEGIDRANSERHRETPTKLLTDESHKD
jgi:curved DNA-binding protein CbpA